VPKYPRVVDKAPVVNPELKPPAAAKPICGRA